MRRTETVEKVGKSWENGDFTGQNEGFYMNLCDFISFFLASKMYLPWLEEVKMSWESTGEITPKPMGLYRDDHGEITG